MAEAPWGAEQVIEHLRKVCKYFELDVVPLRELFHYLEEYDKVYPITEAQAQVVVYYVLEAAKRVMQRQKYQWN